MRLLRGLARRLAFPLYQRSDSDRSMRIFLRADTTVPYGDLMGAMNALRSAGYLKVALVGLESDTSR
jgi:biopolymer transport protein ExbD